MSDRSFPLLSVVIATRNRYIYCVTSINHILTLISQQTELVIQDNSDTNELEKFIFEKADSRVIYNYQPNQLSFVSNFAEAINLCRGKYICLLGDDDTVLSNINKVVSWMELHSIDSVTPKSNVDYVWPNSSIEKYKTGQLTVPFFSGNCEQTNALANLKELLKAGIIEYQRFGLPRLYHGIVKREALLQIKNKTGSYFGGLTPDIYATITLSCIVKKHYVVDFPFTIAGACPASASVISQSGGHSGSLKIAPHLRNRGKYIWDKSIPEYYSVETIWAETTIKALEEMGRRDLLKLFAKYQFMYQAILSNRKYILRLTLKKSFFQYKSYFIESVFHFIKMMIYMPVFSVKKVIEIVNRKVINHSNIGTYKTDDIKTLENAVVVTEKHLQLGLLEKPLK